jgi:hypothetical protein
MWWRHGWNSWRTSLAGLLVGLPFVYPALKAALDEGSSSDLDLKSLCIGVGIILLGISANDDVPTS